MMSDARLHGVRAAAARFGIREASALQTILEALAAGLGGSVARGAVGALHPKVLPALEAVGAAPVRAMKGMLPRGGAPQLPSAPMHAPPPSLEPRILK